MRTSVLYDVNDAFLVEMVELATVQQSAAQAAGRLAAAKRRVLPGTAARAAPDAPPFRTRSPRIADWWARDLLDFGSRVARRDPLTGINRNSTRVLAINRPHEGMETAAVRRGVLPS